MVQSVMRGVEAVDRIRELSHRAEDQWFERKSGRVQAKDLAKALVALANAEGGTVFVGASDDGALEPVPQGKINELRQVPFTLTSPPVRSQISELLVSENATEACLEISVAPGETVHETTAGDCFLRVGDSSHKLNYPQRRELGFDRGAPPFDGTQAPADVTDLDDVQAEQYRQALGSADIPSMLNARSLLTRDETLTVAGALLFMERPQMVYPNAHVRVLRYSGTERGTGSRLALIDGGDVRVDGSLPWQITRAAKVVEKWMPKRTALSPSGTFDPLPMVPTDAWLEGLVNAVVHRSYSIAGDHIRIEIFADRIEITSPGRFPGLVDPNNPLGISRHARNPRIARVLTDLRIARDMGEGIRRIFDEMRRRGLTDPLYTQASSAVHLVLSSHDAVPEEIRDELSKSARLVLDTMRRAGAPLGTGQVAQAANMAKPTAIRALRSLQDLGLVSWEGDSAKDPRATWQLT